MIRHWILPLCLVLLSGCPSKQAHPPAAEADPAAEPDPMARVEPVPVVGDLTLVFGWPEDIQFGIHHERHVEKTGKPGVKANIDYVLTVTPFQEGLLVETGDYVFAPHEDPGLRAALDWVTKFILTNPPKFVVGHDGGFIRLENAEAILDDFLVNFDQFNPGDAPDPQRLAQKQNLAQLFTPEVLEGAVSQWWMAFAGMWSGLTLTGGEVFTDEVEAPIPFLGGASVVLDVTVELLGRVPCTTDESEPSCVRLTFESSIDPKNLEESVKKMLETLTAGDEAARTDLAPLLHSARDFDKHTSIEFICEPDTLIPYALTMTERVQLTMDGPDGEPTLAKKYQKDTYTFTRRD